MNKQELGVRIEAAKVTCLVCGFRDLAIVRHLKEEHSLSIFQYKHQFGAMKLVSSSTLGKLLKLRKATAKTRDLTGDAHKSLQVTYQNILATRVGGDCFGLYYLFETPCYDCTAKNQCVSITALNSLQSLSDDLHSRFELLSDGPVDSHWEVLFA